MFRNLRSMMWPGLVAVALTALGPAAARAQVFDHAGLFGHNRENPIPEADKLIQRMKEDTGKDFVIETFKSPAKGLADVPEDKRDEALKAEKDKVGRMNRAQRDVYFHEWAREEAQHRKVNGVYLLICQKPQTAACVVEPEAPAGKDDPLFPRDKRKWLEDKMRPISGNKHYDDDLLSVAIPGVWYTVQLNQTKPTADYEAWSWKPTLLTIAAFLAFWVGIGAVRGVVVLVTRGRPAGPDPSRTRLGSDTTRTSSPEKPRSEDSVDY
jgi:hypothetical protein